MSGKPQLCECKTNRKSSSQARFPLKTLFESLKQLFQNKCGVWLHWNFCYWDVVERVPRSELSSYWARQTAARSRGGGPGSTHSPAPHPAVPLHLRPHPLTPPLFYVHFNFLPSLSSKLRKEVFHHGAHKTPSSHLLPSTIFLSRMFFANQSLPLRIFILMFTTINTKTLFLGLHNIDLIVSFGINMFHLDMPTNTALFLKCTEVFNS